MISSSISGTSLEESECESRDDLSGSWLRSAAERSAGRVAAVDPIDEAVAGSQALVSIVGFRRSRIRPGERHIERCRRCLESGWPGTAG